ncbi:MAG: hypothetical protein UGA93_09700 [Gemmiger formicilis]|nr:hypothetical protein [Gemmiger formicilis]MEE1513009.1 hypothetical protein [Gemmiger formicilis]
MTKFDGTPCAVKAARTVWSRGKAGDHIKCLPMAIWCQISGHEAAYGGRRRGADRHYPRAAAVRSVRLIGSSFASHKSAEGAAFGRHPPERRATLWISYGIRSRNG